MKAMTQNFDGDGKGLVSRLDGQPRLARDCPHPGKTKQLAVNKLNYTYCPADGLWRKCVTFDLGNSIAKETLVRDNDGKLVRVERSQQGHKNNSKRNKRNI